MTEKQTKNYTNNHNTFGGILESDDFSTSTPNLKRINNQVEADQLPALLSHQKEKLDKEKEYLHMTIEELREMKLVSNTNGRPTSSLTDEKWQKEFLVRKTFVEPYKDGRTKKLEGKHYKESGYWNEETMGTYHGCTNWQEYCFYINDILRNIRSGQIEYCYYIYQVLDLLKFHYSDLRTKYRDGYWEVWLEKKGRFC